MTIARVKIKHKSILCPQIGRTLNTQWKIVGFIRFLVLICALEQVNSSTVPTATPSTMKPTTIHPTAPTIAPSPLPTDFPSAAPSFYPAPINFAVTIYAGMGDEGASDGDGGNAYDAQLIQAQGIFADTVGSVYVADKHVRLINSFGIISTFSGAGYGDVGDAASNVHLDLPYDVWATSSGSVYISESSTFARILVVSPLTGVVSLCAGSEIESTQNNIAATMASLHYPYFISGDSVGNLFLSDHSLSAFRRISVDGIIVTYIGGGLSIDENVAGTSAYVGGPRGSFVDSIGRLHVVDYLDGTVRRVSTSNIITTLVGVRTVPTTGGSYGPASSFLLNQPNSIFGDSTGNIYFIDGGLYMRMLVDGMVYTVADLTLGDLGAYAHWGDTMGNMVVTNSGSIVRKMLNLSPTSAPTGSPTLAPSYLPPPISFAVELYAGLGYNGGASGGDGGTAYEAALLQAQGIFADTLGSVYIADEHIRLIDASGIISTYAGDEYGEVGGPVSSIYLTFPPDVWASSSGFVYISDTAATPRILVVSPVTGIVTTLVGVASGSSANNIAATTASIGNAYFVCGDTVGSIFFSDYLSSVFRKISTDGIVSVHVGKGTLAASNVAATSAIVSEPRGCFVDSLGRLHVVDKTGYEVRRVSTSNIIATIAGLSGITGVGTDGGPASSYFLLNPNAVYGDTAGNIYITDHDAYVRVISNGLMYTVARLDTNGLTAYAMWGDTVGNMVVTSGYTGLIRKLMNLSPTTAPSTRPTKVPTLRPSALPSASPSILPTHSPVAAPFSYSIGTLAGTGEASGNTGDSGAATAATFAGTFGVFIDTTGSAYLADAVSRIRKVTTDGIISTFAGAVSGTSSGDGGAASSATLNQPFSAWADTLGRVFVSDTYGYLIRVVSTTGIINALGGTGIIAVSGSTTPNGDGGQATAANIGIVKFICGDTLGNLYLSDVSAFRVRKISSGGIITNVLGVGTNSLGADNIAATSSAIKNPMGVATDSLGQIYATDKLSGVIRMVSTSLIVTRFAGVAVNDYNGDGFAATSTYLNNPYGIYRDSSGIMFLGDNKNKRYRMITANIVYTVAGNGVGADLSADGMAATAAAFPSPTSIWGDTVGNIGITDGTLAIVRKLIKAVPTITPSQAPSTAPSVAPSCSPSYVPTVVPSVLPTMTSAPSTAPSVIPTTTAPSRMPSIAPTVAPTTTMPSVCPTVTPSFAPSLSPSTILPTSQPVVAPVSYVITTLAGNGISSSHGDGGPATSANIWESNGVTSDTVGQTYICENYKIRSVNALGIISTFAGSSSVGFSGDGGAATSAALNFPKSVRIDTLGSLYFSDSKRIRVISASGIIGTFAGTGATVTDATAMNGDGGAATSAIISGGYLAVDSLGSVYISDSDTHKIRKVDGSGIISLVAGSGSFGVSGNGNRATAAGLQYPNGLFADTIGDVYYADLVTVVRKISNGVISAYAGAGSGYNGDGLALLSTRFSKPYGLWMDSQDSMYLCDSDSARIRLLTSSSVYTVAGTGTTTNAGNGGPATAASIYSPFDVFGDSVGNLIVSTGGAMVRKLWNLNPTVTPSVPPSRLPTTIAPSILPTCCPSSGPTVGPSQIPTVTPTVGPSVAPSYSPSAAPSNFPTVVPSMGPTACPSVIPTTSPTFAFTTVPSAIPSMLPSLDSSATPTTASTDSPTVLPSCLPSISAFPTLIPSMGPSIKPSIIPSRSPTTSLPTLVPTGGPSNPSYLPTYTPTYFTVASPNSYTISTFAGTGTVTSTTLSSGPATSFKFRNTNGLFVGTNGYTYVADGTSVVHSISLAGTVSRFCGFTTLSDSGDGGSASSASILTPVGFWGDSVDRFYITSTLAFKVRRISNDARPIISTFAGGTASATSTALNGDNGPATSALFKMTYFTIGDTSGVVYISDANNHKIRKVDTNNIITTYVGTGESVGSTDSGSGPASNAPLPYPYGMWVDSQGRLYVTSTLMGQIRLVDSAQIISTIAGTGVSAGSDDGYAPTSSKISSPRGIYVDSAYNFFVAEYSTAKIRLISDVMYTVAGNGINTVAGDGGPATSASLYFNLALWGDSAGNLRVSNQGYIRKLTTIIKTSSPTHQPTKIPTILPSVSIVPSCTPTEEPSKCPSVVPSTCPSASPSVYPTVEPSIFPSVNPSLTPSEAPSLEPSVMPTLTPSLIPSAGPTTAPSIFPTVVPTSGPSTSPSIGPSITPTTSPTASPTLGPSVNPSTAPTVVPSISPSKSPTLLPTVQPSLVPSVCPSHRPSTLPSEFPSYNPSLSPSTLPTLFPSLFPTSAPTETPSNFPSISPSELPSIAPSAIPTVSPSTMPSVFPTVGPTINPSLGPSRSPTPNPTTRPTLLPSLSPTVCPSKLPTVFPSAVPTVVSVAPVITRYPTSPTVKPSQIPSLLPSMKPSRFPTVGPSVKPSRLPSVNPTAVPLALPSVRPSVMPTTPTVAPSLPQPTISPAPTVQPTLSLAPSESPSIATTLSPSIIPTLQPTTVAPSVTPTDSPIVLPSVQPSFAPTRTPTTAEFFRTNPKATLPGNDSISVIGRSELSFKIVLPFLIMSNGPFGTVYSNLNLTTDPSAVSYLILGASSLPSSLSVANSIAYGGSGGTDSVLRSASALDDINADGYNDLVIGDPYASRCYVLFGSNNGLTDMTKGFTIFGEFEGDLTGWSVSGAGDVNNDTLADIIVGAPNVKGVGAFYVIYGRRLNNFDVYLSNLTASQGFAMYGAQKSDYLGISVSNAGDVNGDGCDDVIAGGVMTSAFFTGSAFVVYGGRNVQTLSAASFSPVNGISMSGPTYSYVGYSVSAAGDVNKDGLDDVLIGSSPQRATLVPAAYLVYGSKSMTGEVSLTSLTSSQGVRITGGGVAVSYVGDINHDRFDDIMISGAVSTSLSRVGFIVYSNVTHMTKLTASPTVLPTLVPVFAPTKVPTKLPSRLPTRAPTKGPTPVPSLIPTSPTVEPTVGVSEPSVSPSSSSPTIEPSAAPSEAPTIQPSESPSESPTVRPTETPTEKPSEMPSVLPTEVPSIGPSAMPSTAGPTMLDLTRAPFAAPTLLPTVHSTVDEEYNTFYIKGAVSVVNQTNGRQNYIVNTTEPVSIYNTMGTNKYSIEPNAGSVLTIVYMNRSNDVIDLTSFKIISDFKQLQITEGSIILTLPSDQIIHILNLHPGDVDASNFLLYRESSVAGPTKTVRTLSVVAACLIAVGGLTLGCMIGLRLCTTLNVFHKVSGVGTKDHFLMEMKFTLDGTVIDENGNEVDDLESQYAGNSSQSQGDSLREESALLSEHTLNSEGEFIHKNPSIRSRGSSSLLSEFSINTDGDFVDKLFDDDE